MKAAHFGHVETVKTLLELAADTKITNIDGDTALDFALKYDIQDFARKKEICAEIILKHMEEN
jgi:ankyrin repeat protein